MQSGLPPDDHRPTREQRTSPRDLPGWAQVFGSAFTVLTAAATAATFGGAAVALLVALSATTLCAAVFTGLNRRTWDRRKKVVVLLAGMAAAGLVVAAAAVAAAGRGSPTGTSMPTSAAVRDTSAITPEGLQPQPRALEETLQEITW